jgi:dihydrofolate reductase
MITIVAAVAANGVIGANGGLPWDRTGDQRHFKALTLGHVLVMGRRTYDSIGRPLPGRTTVVVTRQPAWRAAEEVAVCHDVDAALDHAATLDREVFVVGGAEIYRAAMRRAERLVITEVHQSPEGDTWFPPVDWSEWEETERAAYDGYTLVDYRRRA